LRARNAIRSVFIAFNESKILEARPIARNLLVDFDDAFLKLAIIVAPVAVGVVPVVALFGAGSRRRTVIDTVTAVRTIGAAGSFTGSSR